MERMLEFLLFPHFLILKTIVRFHLLRSENASLNLASNDFRNKLESKTGILSYVMSTDFKNYNTFRTEYCQ